MSKKTNAEQVVWQQPELVEQTAKLAEMFYGNTIFDSIRGQLNGDFLTVARTPLLDEHGKLKSRTQEKKDVRKFFDSFAWVQERISTLERLGMLQAVDEVRTALLRPGYQMLGEAKLLDTLVPMTAIIFEAPLTLCVLNRSIHEKCFKTKDIPAKIRKILLHPHEFKTAGKLIHNRTIFERLETFYDPYKKKLTHLMPKRWWSYCYSCASLPISQEDSKDRSKYVFGGIIHLIQATREEILQLLTDEEQKKTASWEFELPESFFSQHKINLKKLEIGLHLREENTFWSKMRPKFCSINDSFGRCAVINPGEAYKCFDRQSTKFLNTRLLF
jgi:hypothetical protein